MTMFWTRSESNDVSERVLEQDPKSLCGGIFEFHTRILAVYVSPWLEFRGVTDIKRVVSRNQEMRRLVKSLHGSSGGSSWEMRTGAAGETREISSWEMRTGAAGDWHTRSSAGSSELQYG